MNVRQALRVRGDSDGTSAGSREIDSVSERIFIDLAPSYRSIKVMLGNGRGAEARGQALRAETL